MSEIAKEGKPKDARAHAAMHPAWRLRREAAVFVDAEPVAANIVALGSEMSLWLGQKGNLTAFTEADRNLPRALTNPYTYAASSLALQLASVINEMSDFAGSASLISPIEAEVSRIRFESELILLFTRFCEAAIKQMLYCTTIDDKHYRRAAMGSLLAFDCRKCRKARKPHFISMLGALAHRYFCCHVLESCLFDHLAFAGAQRNDTAAHSDTKIPRACAVEDSRAAAMATLQEVGQELGHMCQHIGEIEEKMIAEISLWIGRYPETPGYQQFMKIPARVHDSIGPPADLKP